MDNNNSIVTDAINKVADFLTTLEATNNNKAEKIAYWLRDYVYFLKAEERFDPLRYKKYKRGDIIKVHLGFNIGNEEGGLHYAVVLDTMNSVKATTLTIIPLTSIKPDKDLSALRNYEVNCGNAIYNALSAKISATSQNVRNEILNIGKEIGALEAKAEKDSLNEGLRNRLDRAMEKAHQLELMQQEIAKMKNGSIALIKQITTVSKIRIRDPISTYDVLHGIRMPNEILDIIDDRIRLFFTENEKKSENPSQEISEKLLTN